MMQQLADLHAPNPLLNVLPLDNMNSTDLAVTDLATLNHLKWDQAYPIKAAGTRRQRVEHIRHASRLPLARLGDPAPTINPQPLALVCFGPSLQDTWKEIADFPNVMSTSGSHHFLLERGIVPTWHVEVDPRPHKTQLIGSPHRAVTYLIASVCHPKLFAALAGYDVRLFHLYANSPEVVRVIPRGEWALTGGGSVGLRALVLARFLGFTDIHIFGMDGCVREGQTHAGEHPNSPRHILPLEYGGQTYRTAINLLVYARTLWPLLDCLQDVTPTFHGEGLVQHAAQNYVRRPREASLAARKMPLVSPEYRAQLLAMHAATPEFGHGGSEEHREATANIVTDLAQSFQARSVLDYGCGKGTLADDLDFPVWEFDPGVPGKDEDPRPADLVVCTDVLEHVEPDRLVHVLVELVRCVRKVAYVTVRTVPARKTLPDGRNAHLSIHPPEWWLEFLQPHFVILSHHVDNDDVHIILGAKPSSPSSSPSASLLDTIAESPSPITFSSTPSSDTLASPSA